MIFNNLAEKAQQLADFVNMKIMYNITKQLITKFNKSSGETFQAKHRKKDKKSEK